MKRHTSSQTSTTTERASEAGTSEANASLYKTSDRVNGTYKTVSGLPWAREFILESDDFYP
jgi:hypothetical protein